MSITDDFVAATRVSGIWDDDTRQINISVGAGEEHILNAFKALAWLERLTHKDLIAKLVAEEVEYLALHTDVLTRVADDTKTMRVRKAARPAPRNKVVPDEVAEKVDEAMSRRNNDEGSG